MFCINIHLRKRILKTQLLRIKVLIKLIQSSKFTILGIVRLILFFLIIYSNVLFCQQRLPLNDSIQNFLFAMSESKTPIIITKNGIFEFKTKWNYSSFIDNSFKKQIEKINELNNKNFFTITIANKLYLVYDGAGPVFLKEGNTFKRIDNTMPHNNQFVGSRFVYNNKIHIYGGYGFWSFKNFITFYDENINQWDLIYNDSKNIPNGRWKPIYNLIDDKLYVFGGRSGTAGSINQDETFSDIFYFDFNSKEFINLGNINPKIKPVYSLFAYPKIKETTYAIYDYDNISQINFENLTVINYFKKNAFIGIDNKFPTFINNQTLFYISELKEKKYLNAFDLNSIDQSYLSESFPLTDKESKTPIGQYLLFGILISILFWIILKIFLFKDYIKGLILYDDKTIYFNNNSASVNKQEQQLISFLSTNKFISSSRLNKIISSQDFAKSHFTTLRSKLVLGLNDKLFKLTNKENCIIETKDQKDSRIKNYKADSSIIKKKINFLSFLFKR